MPGDDLENLRRLAHLPKMRSALRHLREGIREAGQRIVRQARLYGPHGLPGSQKFRRFSYERDVEELGREAAGIRESIKATEQALVSAVISGQTVEQIASLADVPQDSVRSELRRFAERRQELAVAFWEQGAEYTVRLWTSAVGVFFFEGRCRRGTTMENRHSYFPAGHDPGEPVGGVKGCISFLQRVLPEHDCPSEDLADLIAKVEASTNQSKKLGQLIRRAVS